MRPEIQKSVIFVAGKSGGHIIPCGTIAQEYNNQGYKTFFFITDGALDKKIINSYSFLERIIPLKIEMHEGIWGKIKFVYYFLKTFIQSFKELRKIKPEKVISSGGSIALPVCFASWTLRIPIELYELNVIPGKAIKLLSKIATKTYVCFDASKKILPKSLLASYPVRFEIEDRIAKEEACKSLGLDPYKKTVVILGGSQGSQFINNLAISWLKDIPERHKNMQIIHQTGSKDLDSLKEAYSSLGLSVVIFDYTSQMRTVYSSADIIIARAGAGTLFEILFFKKQALIIPLEGKAADHQIDNAHAMAQAYPDYFKVLRQSDAHPEIILKLIDI